MSLHSEQIGNIPTDIARVIKAIFPDGDSFCLKLRDTLGTIFQDEQFKALFSTRGQSAEAPWRLALVSLLQFKEGLTDREAAEAVRTRLDWKYLLNLDLTDRGFDYSVLCEFRSRLLEHNEEEKLLDTLLMLCKEKGWLKEGDQIRTDSTQVVGAARKLNRLGSVHETLRHSLNVLSLVAPEWLRHQVKAEWNDRYSTHFESFQLSKKELDRQLLAKTIGEDGKYLLELIYQLEPEMEWLKKVPAVEILRQVWLQQYSIEEDCLRFREEQEIPPAALEILSPHDVGMRACAKRQTQWVGYKVQLTETCEEERPHLITQVETTPATEVDSASLKVIQSKLAKRGYTPKQHLVDAGYCAAENLVESKQNYGLELIGPVSEEGGWQAQAKTGYAASDFAVNWEAQQARCPEGKTSTRWWKSYDRHGKDTLKVGFAKSDCRDCAVREKCSRDIKTGRILTLKSDQAQYEALREARERQKTSEFREQYRNRAGIEGTISQGVNSFELRKCRYIGQAKVHLQHVLTAAALDLARIEDWLENKPQVIGYISPFARLALAS